MKIYYMRDNHTFVPLPLDVELAESLLRKEFEKGWTYGMCCSQGMQNILHAKGRHNDEQFFADARAWVQRAIHFSVCEESK